MLEKRRVRKCGGLLRIFSVLALSLIILNVRKTIDVVSSSQSAVTDKIVYAPSRRRRRCSAVGDRFGRLRSRGLERPTQQRLGFL